MRCPICRQPVRVARIRYSELGPDNELHFLDVAELSCGCVVRLRELPSEYEADMNWEAAIRRRRDDNLRSVFT